MEHSVLSFRRRCRLAVVRLFTLLLAGQAYAQDASWQFRATALRTESTWQEFDNTGRRLLTESGLLNGTELQMSHRFGNWDWSGHWAQQQGSRAYMGETSLGQPIATDVAITMRTLGASAAYHWTPALSAALRLEHRRTDRIIASVGTAAGYPEQFNWLLASVGVRGQLQLPGSQLHGSVWWGLGPPATMQLSLPGRDPANLSSGRITQSEVQLAWVLPLGTDACLRVNTGWQETNVAEGVAAVIRRSGVPVATARQPHTRMTHRPLGVGLEVRF